MAAPAPHRPSWAPEARCARSKAFYLYDGHQAAIEPLTAFITLRHSREIADCVRAHAGLATMAVYGHPARARIRAASNFLG
ncbi:hypothetical protein GCM10010417_41040 [Streptomyces carpaticus]